MTPHASPLPAGSPPGVVAADEATRVSLAANGTSPAEVLIELASDPAITVRAAVALNAAAPVDAHKALTRDADVRIRRLLVNKLTPLAIAQPVSGHDEDRQHARQMVAVLAEDGSMRVRAGITEIAKQAQHAPHALMLWLAQDKKEPVSEPVVRLSPVLTTEDLLALLASPPNDAIPVAIAKRLDLSETLAEAVIATDNPAAITALLANQSAPIRMAMLEKLTTRSDRGMNWEELIVRRSRPSQSGSVGLSEFLPGRKQLRAHTLEEAMGEARALAARHELDEAVLLAALDQGDTRMATALLAVAADVRPSLVERAVTMHNAKALVSLAWRAEFSMEAAVSLQMNLARNPAGLVLRPGQNGAFPLAREEMCWQITLLQTMGR